MTTETFVTTYDNCEITLSPFQLTYTPKVSIGTIPTCFSVVCHLRVDVTCDAASPDISKMYENLVLRDNVGPQSSKKLSDICQKSVRKLSVTRMCQKTVINVSEFYQKNVKLKYLSELYQ